MSHDDFPELFKSGAQSMPATKGEVADLEARVAKLEELVDSLHDELHRYVQACRDQNQAKV